MRLIGNLIVLVFAVVVFACNSSQKREGNEEVLSFKNGTTKAEKFGNCDTVKGAGVVVTVDLWLPSDSGNVSGKITEQLNKKVVERINSYGDPASVAANPVTNSAKDAFTVFEKNYNDFKKGSPDAPGCWEVELKGDTVMVTPKVLLYKLNHYFFTGGAHPNSFRSFHVFDLETGEEKDIKNYVSDSVALLKKVEVAFRSLEKLSADANLEKEGYFLANNKFFLPANYIFTKEGVLFYYNAYEISTYARGPIEFTIPYSELEGIVKKDLIF